MSEKKIDLSGASSSNRPGAARATATARRIDARDLFAGEREVLIMHAGREYRLRVTNTGKLILTA